MRRYFVIMNLLSYLYLISDWVYLNIMMETINFKLMENGLYSIILLSRLDILFRWFDYQCIVSVVEIQFPLIGL